MTTIAQEMDLVLRLREARRLAGISQKEAATRSSVGEKTISSFETGARIDALKVAQLERLLKTYGISIDEFFGDELAERAGAADLVDDRPRLRGLVYRIANLDASHQETVIRSLAALVERAEQAASRGRRIL